MSQQINEPNVEQTLPSAEDSVSDVSSPSGLKPVVKAADAGEKGKRKPGKRKKNKTLRVLLAVLCVLLALILAVGATGVIMYFKGKNYYKNYEINISAPDGVELVNDDGSKVKYKEETYIYNVNVVSILVMGVDRESLEEEFSAGRNGQADAIYLVVLNTKTKDATILGLSRDTVAEIDTYSLSGTYMGIEKQQICLAYSYGNGKDTSCENTKSAVARTLYNIPIHSYVAIDMDAIPKLTDCVGGVTVPEYSEDLMTLTGGEIELNSENALKYIRERSHETAEANNARMDRQGYFIDRFSSKLIDQTKNDITTPLDVYKSLNKYDYMVTDITASQVTYLAKNFISGLNHIDRIKVPGEARTTEPDSNGKKYAEFYIDYTSLYDIILDLYYIKG